MKEGWWGARGSDHTFDEWEEEGKNCFKKKKRCLQDMIGRFVREKKNQNLRGGEHTVQAKKNWATPLTQKHRKNGVKTPPQKSPSQ